MFHWKDISYVALFLFQFVIIFPFRYEGKSNWAVLVGSSRYYFNYRHYSNLLSIRNAILTLGIPTSNIIVLNAGYFSNDPRNSVKGDIIGYGKDLNSTAKLKRRLLLSFDSPFTYQREEDVSVESLVSLLTGRSQYTSYHSSCKLNPSSYSPLQSDEDSSVLLYLSGHGGDGFFKFHDSQELSAEQLAETILEMHLRGRFSRMLVVADTCQAATLGRFFPPSVQLLSSSASGENSYADSADPVLGVAVTDRFSLRLVDLLQSPVSTRNISLLEAFPRRLTFSTASLTLKTSAGDADLGSTAVNWRSTLKDFFSSSVAAMSTLSEETLAQLQEGIETRMVMKGLENGLNDSDWLKLLREDLATTTIIEQEEEVEEEKSDYLRRLYWSENRPFVDSILRWALVMLIILNMAVHWSPSERS